MATHLRLMFGGDAMLGRHVRDVMRRDGIHAPLAAVTPLLRAADLAVVNLECALTDSLDPWHGAPKAYYFGALPEAGQALLDAGIQLVSLANNHSLDYDVQGLADTLRILDAHGIAHTGAGPDLAWALAPAVVPCGDVLVGMAAFCDHQDDFAATDDHPGIAWLNLHDEAAATDAFARALAPMRAAGVRWPILSLHWGPNMVTAPSPHLRRLARAAIDIGWKIVYGHSAHVFHGVELYRGWPILYAAGDLVDDYAVDPDLRNDHQLLFEVQLGADALARIVLHPVFIRHGRVAPADHTQRAWGYTRMQALCRDLGTAARLDGDVLVIEPDAATAHE
jgi:poly-gamma-glutamate capsule biosynthesis protein CapA/YwtB (metallophosphatase superfamily)